jgi:hypothetical protein
MYGPPADLFGGDQSQPRRTIYGFINRLDVSPLLTTFDFPNPIASTPGRVSTTVPPQALYLMNNQFVPDAAARLAKQASQPPSETSQKITAVYELLFARPPAAEEFELATEFLGPQPEEGAWLQYLHGLLMTNEFVFID